MYLSILLLMNVCSNYFWILTLTVLFRYCYNVGNVVDLSRYLSHSTSFSWWECPKFRHQKKYITRTENYPYQQLSQNLWYFDEIKRKLMKSFFHYCSKKNWINFGLGSLYNLFLSLCIWEKIAFFFRTRASTVIPTKWCKAFEAWTWTISEFAKNLPIWYNI